MPRRTIVPHATVFALLRGGLTFREVSAATGLAIRSVRERNARLYHVNMQAAFRKRIRREGIKVRRRPAPSFAWWFSGFFDGEGCLLAAVCGTRHHARVQISLRRDDTAVLLHIQRVLRIGVVKEKKGPPMSGPQVIWVVASTRDLLEVIIPLFDSYPLRTRKKKEYRLWKEFVMNIYVATLGQSTGFPMKGWRGVATYRARQKQLAARIGKIRHLYHRQTGVAQTL